MLIHKIYSILCSADYLAKDYYSDFFLLSIIFLRNFLNHMQPVSAIITNIMVYQGFSTYGDFIKSVQKLFPEIPDFRVYDWKKSKLIPADLIDYCEKEKIPLDIVVFSGLQSCPMKKKLPTKKICSLLDKAEIVLTHKNPLVSESLAKNIECFHHTVECEKKIDELENKEEKGDT